MAGKFDKLLKSVGTSVASSSKKAVEWYKDSAWKMKTMSARDFLDDPNSGIKLSNNISENYMGKMVLFFYDPKYKEELPFYDRYPLIFPIEWYGDGSMLGINLHYLPPNMRAQLLDALVTNLLPKNGRKKNLVISYKILKSAAQYKSFRPCVKKYLLSHVRSKFQIVPVEHWDKVIFLPLERFEKKSKNEVWKDSKKKIK